MVVAGVDGFPRGWVVATWDGKATALSTYPDFAAVLSATAACAIVTVDMPIGFLDWGQKGGRACEDKARKFVGAGKAPAVFSSPIRDALLQPDYPTALAANRAKGGIGIAKQAFGLFLKMRDIDAVITPDLQKRCKEIHPEVSFAAMARLLAPQAGTASLQPKKTAGGQLERKKLLGLANFQELPELIAAGRLQGAAADDVLDACAAAWTAQRIAQGQAVSLPKPPPHDSRGLEMAIWY